MDWLALTAVSVLFRSIYGVMTKVLSNKVQVSSYTQGMILPLCGALIALICSPLLGGLKFNLGDISVVALLLVVLGQGLGNIVYFEAMKSLTSSTAQIAFSSVLVWNTLLSIGFLHLHLSPINVIGLMMLMIAVISVSTGKIVLNRRGVLLMIASAFLFAVFQLASANVSKHISAASYLVIAYGGAALVVWALSFKKIIKDLRIVRDARRLLGIPLLTAVPSVGNFLFAYYAYRSAPAAAKVAMLLTSQVVITVLLSYIFLKEKDSVNRKVFAAVLVLLAAILIKQ